MRWCTQWLVIVDCSICPSLPINIYLIYHHHYQNGLNAYVFMYPYGCMWVCVCVFSCGRGDSIPPKIPQIKVVCLSPLTVVLVLCWLNRLGCPFVYLFAIVWFLNSNIIISLLMLTIDCVCNCCFLPVWWCCWLLGDIVYMVIGDMSR